MVSQAQIQPKTKSCNVLAKNCLLNELGQIFLDMQSYYVISQNEFNF